MIFVILSGNVDCFDIIFNYVDYKNINSNCIFKFDFDLVSYNKYRKFIFLIMVCYNGFFIVIRKLVKEGVDVNFKDKNGSMLLVLVCWFGFFLDFKFLVNKNVNFNCVNINGEIFLIVVVMNRNINIVKFFFDNNVVIN